MLVLVRADLWAPSRGAHRGYCSRRATAFPGVLGFCHRRYCPRLRDWAVSGPDARLLAQMVGRAPTTSERRDTATHVPVSLTQSSEKSRMTPTEEQAYLQQFNRFLTRRAAPMASHMDRDSDILRHIFEAFKHQRGLAVRLPRHEGGCFLSDQGFASFRIQLARYCGSLSFLQAQHQVAVSWLTKSPDPSRVRPWYESILQAGTALGIGFLSPRHQAFEVRQEGTTYMLSGDIPWVTGYGFLQHIVTSFQKNGYRHFLLLPFTSCRRDAGQLSYSEPLRLIVFNALNTVRARLENWRVHQEEIFLSLPVTAQRVPERHNSVYTLAGASIGLQDLVRQLSDLPDGMTRELQRLGHRLEIYTRTIMVAGGSPSALRAEGARLAQDWAALARWAYGGKALLLDHPVNRLSREIWQYCIAGLRPGDLEFVYPSG